MGPSPNQNSTYTILPPRISWPLTLYSTRSPFALQTLGKPNRVVWTTNSGCTKPRAHILAPGARANSPPINCNIIAQKDTVIPYIAQPRYPLNSQVLAIFFPSATITTTP